MRFAVATLPAASVASTVTFASTFLPSRAPCGPVCASRQAASAPAASYQGPDRASRPESVVLDLRQLPLGACGARPAATARMDPQLAATRVAIAVRLRVLRLVPRELEVRRGAINTVRQAARVRSWAPSGRRGTGPHGAACAAPRRTRHRCAEGPQGRPSPSSCPARPRAGFGAPSLRSAPGRSMDTTTRRPRSHFMTSDPTLPETRPRSLVIVSSVS